MELNASGFNFTIRSPADRYEIKRNKKNRIA